MFFAPIVCERLKSEISKRTHLLSSFARKDDSCHSRLDLTEKDIVILKLINNKWGMRDVEIAECRSDDRRAQ